MSKIAELKKINTELKSLQDKLDTFMYQDTAKLRNKQNQRIDDIRVIVDEARKFNARWRKIAQDFGFEISKDSIELNDSINKLVKPLNAFIKNTASSLGR